MCLFKNKAYHPHNRPLIAKEDIVCYKKLHECENNIYVTPCTYTRIPIECIQDKVPFKAKIINKFKFIWRHVFGFSNLVEDGFIHTLQKDYGHRNCETFKCIIPKGTKYFIGYEMDFASERIIFLEKLK